MSGCYVLLDRDGTVNVDRHYLSDPGLLEFLPGAITGLRRLQELGCGLIVVTNQSGVGRGLISPRQLAEVHRRLHERLEDAGITLDAVYVCPHHPEENCNCRKPEPGLALRAAHDFGFDLQSSFVIGDKPCDVELGRRVGATTFLVGSDSGAGREPASAPLRLGTSTENLRPDFVITDLAEGARVIAEILERRQRLRIAA